VTSGARSRPIQLMSAAGSRHPPVVALRGEHPGKNEQPRPIAGVHPHPPSRRRALASPVHPHKAGRHRARRSPRRALRLSREAVAHDMSVSPAVTPGLALGRLARSCMWATQSRAARPSLTPRWGTHVVPQTLPRYPIGAPTPTGPRLRRTWNERQWDRLPTPSKTPPCTGVTSQIRR
jgi:hypothetical protein